MNRDTLREQLHPLPRDLERSARNLAAAAEALVADLAGLPEGELTAGDYLRLQAAVGAARGAAMAADLTCQRLEGDLAHFRARALPGAGCGEKARVTR
jgi:hypothetical protein